MLQDVGATNCSNFDYVCVMLHNEEQARKARQNFYAVRSGHPHNFFASKLHQGDDLFYSHLYYMVSTLSKRRIMPHEPSIAGGCATELNYLNFIYLII